MSKNLSELSGRKGLADNLFEELGIAARQTGTPSREDMERLTEEFLVGKANVYGSVSFYDFMKPGKQGQKNIPLQRQRLPDGRHAKIAGSQAGKPFSRIRDRHDVLPRPLPRKQRVLLRREKLFGRRRRAN